ncbi:MULTISPECIES: protein-glutamate O-methyltransferase CheR [Myxococcaceae]|uniref:CheR family methyltransferase n=1 Tax=Myxococcaceae TaxID=31 RepID=UPI002715134A|nr:MULTISPECIES: protein-glutamate O-methyltransferase CheR [Myxococcaceae]
MALPLSPPVFSILSGLIEARAGLHYAPSDQELLAEKVSERALEAGFDSLLDYYYFLRYDPAGPAALDALIDTLTVHETYFFREVDQLRALVDGVLVPRARQGLTTRVWSAACSTGEEPLTLAMMLAERGLSGAGSRVELVASDISQKVLERAQRGEFGRRSLRALPPGIDGRFLDVAPGSESATVRAELREQVQWKRVNLVDPKQVAALGRFHVILCRNVMIYFSDETARRVVESLTTALEPGGHLLVGTSESLLRFGTQLLCEEKGGAFFYTKEAAR